MNIEIFLMQIQTLIIYIIFILEANQQVLLYIAN